MKLRAAANHTYFLTVSALGAVVVAHSVWAVISGGVSYQWLILAYLTVLTGAFTIQLAGLKSMFSLADTFIFLNTMMFGTAAGTLTAALDGFLASMRLETAARKRRTAPLNTAVMALSAFGAGQVFYRLLGSGPLSKGSSVGIFELVLPAVCCALAYFLCNSTLVAARVTLVRGGNLLRTWHDGFLKTSVVFLGSAMVAAVLGLSIRAITPLALLVVACILVSLYFLHKFYLEPDAAPVAGSENGPVAQRAAYRRFHYFMVVLGMGFIALLVQDIFREKIGYQWMVLAALTVLAGMVTVKIPGIKIKFSLGDTFVFANLMLFGPVIGGITAALDGLAGSLRCETKTRKLEFMVFNIAAMALSAYAVGELFFWILGKPPLYLNGVAGTAQLFLPAVALALSYYFLNASAVALIVALQEHRSMLRIWLVNLAWGFATVSASALGAVFLAAGIVSLAPTSAVAIALLLVALYVTYKAFTRSVAPPLPDRVNIPR